MEEEIPQQDPCEWANGAVICDALEWFAFKEPRSQFNFWKLSISSRCQSCMLVLWVAVKIANTEMIANLLLIFHLYCPYLWEWIKANKRHCPISQPISTIGRDGRQNWQLLSFYLCAILFHLCNKETSLIRTFSVVSHVFIIERFHCNLILFFSSLWKILGDT